MLTDLRHMFQASLNVSSFSPMVKVLVWDAGDPGLTAHSKAMTCILIFPFPAQHSNGRAIGYSGWIACSLPVKTVPLCINTHWARERKGFYSLVVKTLVQEVGIQIPSLN